MRLLLLLLLCPFITLAQINPVYVVKPNLSYAKLEASGDDMFGFEENGKFGYMDKNQKVIIPATYSFESTTYKNIPPFDKGYVVIKKDGKTGLLDKTGKVVVPFEYESLFLISSLNNHATVSKRIDGKIRYGIVSTSNKVVIPVEYEDMLADSNYVAVKQPGGKWGLLDITGKKIIPFEYTSLSVYPKDKAVKAEKDGKIIFMDLTGKTLFEKVKNVYTIYGVSQGMILTTVSSKYGFLDLKGEEVIITKYDNAFGFETVGMAKVARKVPGSSYTYKYGYIDKKGTEVIPITYETIGNFSNGLVYAKDPETNRYGYLDRTGKWALKPVYIEVTPFDVHGGAWVKMTDGQYHYINKTGKDHGAFAPTGGYKTFLADGYAVYEHADYPYGLIDKTGKVLKTIDDCEGIYNFSENIAGYKSKSTSKYGFVDFNGNKIIPAEYDGFTGFVEGVSKVDKTIDGKTKSGYIDTKGTVILPVEQTNLKGFRNGWGVLKKDNKHFFVDKKGNLTEAARNYDDLSEFRSGYAMARINGTGGALNTYYYINTDLKEELTITAKTAYPFWDNVAIIQKDTYYEIMDKKGNIIKTLSTVATLKFCTEGMMAVKETNGKWGYIDEKGTPIVQAKYDSCEQFKYGYGRVRLNGKWGVVDKTGKEIFEPKYTNIVPGDNGLFIYYDNAWGIMDRTGKTISPPVFNNITIFEKDRAMVRLGKTYTIIKSPLVK
jgi:hypothetical protein